MESQLLGNWAAGLGSARARGQHPPTPAPPLHEAGPVLRSMAGSQSEETGNMAARGWRRTRLKRGQLLSGVWAGEGLFPARSKVSPSLRPIPAASHPHPVTTAHSWVAAHSSFYFYKAWQHEGTTHNEEPPSGGHPDCGLRAGPREFLHRTCL